MVAFVSSVHAQMVGLVPDVMNQSAIHHVSMVIVWPPTHAHVIVDGLVKLVLKQSAIHHVSMVTVWPQTHAHVIVDGLVKHVLKLFAVLLVKMVEAVLPQTRVLASSTAMDPCVTI